MTVKNIRSSEADLQEKIGKIADKLESEQGLPYRQMLTDYLAK